MENIKRREAVRRVAWIMGGTLSAPTLAGILNGCTPRPDLTWTPVFFTEDQARLVMEIAEDILPETNTKGAKSLGVPGFIEEMVSTVYPTKDREQFLEGLAAFDKACDEQMGDPFVALSAEKRKAFLTQKNDELIANKSKWETRSTFFYRIKELTLIGYFTTEYGATQVLQYQAIPVEYKGCIPLSETGNGKTWAT